MSETTNLTEKQKIAINEYMQDLEDKQDERHGYDNAWKNKHDALMKEFETFKDTFQAFKDDRDGLITAIENEKEKIFKNHQEILRFAQKTMIERDTLVELFKQVIHGSDTGAKSVHEDN